VSPARWHRRPTPSFGGIAIFVGFAVALVAQMLLSGGDLSIREVSSYAVVPLTHRDGLLIAAVMIFALGLVDDLVQLRPSTKLVGQLAAASMLLISGVGVWLTGSYLVDVTVSLFWFIGITNALNLLDNMDGLAGGVGAIAASFMGVNFLLAGDVALAGVAFAFAGALVGFLVHNYPPARIFMGDSGSLFTGLVLAGLALSPAPGLSRSLFAVVAVPAIVLAVPILDTTFVTVTRLLEGRPISEGGRDHTSHGLVALGISEERVAWLVWGLAVGGGLIGLGVRSASRPVAYAVGGVLLILLTLLGLYLLSSRMRELRRWERADDRASDAGKSDDGGTDDRRIDEVGADEAHGAQVFNRLVRLHHRFPLLTVLMDVVLVAIAYFGAYLVRWDTEQLPAELAYFRQTLAMVIALKLMGLAAAGAYAPRFSHYSLGDVWGTIRANILGTLLAASVLFLVFRVGLSRGVLIVDFLLCATLTVVGRVSFRFLDDVKEKWSSEGAPAAFVGRIEDAELAFRALRGVEEPRLRLVAVVDYTYGGRRGGFKGYPLFGGDAGIERAVRECGVTAVVVIDQGGMGEEDTRRVREYLKWEGAVDVYAMRISVGPVPVEAGAGNEIDAET
jgi:UDP-GlcNAc:undecaprenyl-phosphate GlcNAc-1-phosphate transferase